MRQNTLPNRLKGKVQRQVSIVDKIRQLGGQAYVDALSIEHVVNREPSEDKSRRRRSKTIWFSHEDDENQNGIVVANELYDVPKRPSDEKSTEGDEDRSKLLINELYDVTKRLPQEEKGIVKFE